MKKKNLFRLKGKSINKLMKCSTKNLDRETQMIIYAVRDLVRKLNKKESL